MAAAAPAPARPLFAPARPRSFAYAPCVLTDALPDGAPCTLYFAARRATA